MMIKELRLPYFNGCFNVYIDTYDKVEFPKKTEEYSINGGVLRYGYDKETGIASFGLWYEQETKRPGHGGLWSSRESVAGPIMGLRLVNTAINMFSSSMTVEKLSEILPDDFEVIARYTGGGTTVDLAANQSFLSDGKEIVYEVQRKDRQTGPGAPYSGTKPLTYTFELS